ncbi:LysR family transcriptional regulator [Polyangium sp. 6x1]|uniref:LysR family transcriptional regulator n=1 Tax=Polyangium sp. 6x1 TaxID=3042689 RepID=UPI002482D178|nr:LysR family transcriptional regulator [Polyangium sp. 6x1]MDI1450594.1 LysR family transcriptional regulator [Polyangium sp. 6x1]
MIDTAPLHTGASLPDLESLRCFLAAARHLNFRVAARAVALSPAAFSDRIQRLEDTLGAPLFDRTTRRVALTAAGERLVPEAQRCLDQARRCGEVVLREDGAPMPYELTIGTRFELGLSWLVPALDALTAARPERRLHLSFGDTPDLVRQAQRDVIDAFVSSARLSDAGFSYARLHEERYVFVGQRQLLARRPLADREDCAAHTLLDAQRDLPLFRYFLDTRPGSEDWAFRRVEVLGTIGAVRLRALAGAGVAVLPHYFVASDLRRGRLVPILPKAKLPSDWFRLVWREGHPREAALRKLAEDLVARPLR